jgi:hypothetical protein
VSGVSAAAGKSDIYLFQSGQKKKEEKFAGLIKDETEGLTPLSLPGTHLQANFLCLPGTFTQQVSAGQSRIKPLYLFWIPACAGMTSKAGSCFILEIPCKTGQRVSSLFKLDVSGQRRR